MFGIGGLLKAGATALLGRAVKKGIKGAGKAVVKGVKGGTGKVVKGAKAGAKGAQQVAGGVKEVVKSAPTAFNLSKTAMSKYGFKEANDVVKTTIAGAYMRGTNNVKRKQAFDIINKMMAKPELKNIRDMNQLSKALKKIEFNNRASQPPVAEIAKYSWRGLKKLLKGAPAKAVEGVKKVGSAVKGGAKEGVSDYVVGRAVQIGGGTLMGVGTTAGSIAIADKVRGK